MNPRPIHLLAVVAALAACAASAMAAPEPATQVSGVEVAAGPGPMVVSSYPADAAAVPAGVLVLKITFDQAMEPKSWAFAASGTDAFPVCLAEPRLLADRRSFALLCTVEPGKSYALQINPAPRFKNEGGRSAQPYSLHFSTTADITRDIHAALTLAGLADTDAPIMSADDAGKGVSASPPADAPAPETPR